MDYNNHPDLIDKLIHMRIKEGKTRQDIFLFLRDELKFAKSTCYAYIKEAFEESEERAVIAFGKTIQEDIDRAEEQYRICLENGMQKELIKWFEVICKLKGHFVERQVIQEEVVFKAKFGNSDDISKN